MSELICDDLVVLELAAGKVAPSEVGMFLADQGARVLKVEAPGGDPLRVTRPAGWLVWNRGKESVVADLGTEEGRDRVRELARRVDVVIESLGAGRAEELGLGYEQLSGENPGLVYCSIDGYGSTGPYAAVPAYDALVLAKNGSFARGDFAFRSGPIFSGALMASNGAAHQAVSAILAALMVRDDTGFGQSVGASLFQGLNPNDYFMAYHAQLAQIAPAAPSAEAGSDPSRRVPAATRYGASSCTRDGRWIFFSPQQAHQAHAMMQVLELEHLLEDERFADMPAFWTLEDADAWDRAVHGKVKEHDVDHWVERALLNPDLPFEVVLSAEEALDHPQVRANGNVVSVADPDHGPIEQIGPIAAFRATPSVIARSAPRLGDHGSLDLVPAPARTSGAPVPPHPLAGKTIVELGYYYAMPFGVTMAASLGARVIKVEGIDGDPMRWSFGPFEWGSAKTMEGKESICLDARSDRGREILYELIERADVFVQGFRPGVDERLGVEYETLSALNSRLVYVHGAGYGTTGPYAHRPIYAGTAIAAAGSVHRQSAHWLDAALNASLDTTESQVIVAPRLRGLTDGDANAALGVLSAICFGLRHQARTGRGQFISTSMIGGNVLAYADDFNRFEGKVPVRQLDPDQFGDHALERVYRADDGWVCVVVPSQPEWLAFTDAVARPDLADDPRFAGPAERLDHDGALEAELQDVFLARGSSAWEQLLLGAGVGCVAVTEVGQAATTVGDPVLREMGLVSSVDHPLFGPILRYGAPAEFSMTPGRVDPGCTIAQHTRAILGELGRSDDDIATLVAGGVVRVAD